MAQGRLVAVVTGSSDFWMRIEGRAGGLGTEGQMIGRRPGMQQARGPRLSNPAMFFTTLRSPGGWDPVRPVLTQPDSGQEPTNYPSTTARSHTPGGAGRGLFRECRDDADCVPVEVLALACQCPRTPSPVPKPTGHGTRPSATELTVFKSSVRISDGFLQPEQ